jgi:hypothetical protein
MTSTTRAALYGAAIFIAGLLLGSAGSHPANSDPAPQVETTDWYQKLRTIPLRGNAEG